MGYVIGDILHQAIGMAINLLLVTVVMLVLFRKRAWTNGTAFMLARDIDPVQAKSRRYQALSLENNRQSRSGD